MKIRFAIERLIAAEEISKNSTCNCLALKVSASSCIMIRYSQSNLRPLLGSEVWLSLHKFPCFSATDLHRTSQLISFTWGSTDICIKFWRFAIWIRFNVSRLSFSRNLTRRKTTKSKSELKIILLIKMFHWALNFKVDDENGSKRMRKQLFNDLGW